MRVAWIDELQRTLMDSAKSQRGLNFLFLIFVLLSTACPTSPESDQTKEGGRSGVQKTPRFGAESERFDLTKIWLSSNLSPKEFAKKIREWMEKPGENCFPPITKQKGNRQRDLTSLYNTAHLRERHVKGQVSGLLPHISLASQRFGL